MSGLLQDIARRVLPIGARELIATFRGRNPIPKERRREHRRARALASRVARGRHLAKVRLREGTFLVDLRDQGVAGPMYLRGCYEPSETRLFQGLLRPGMTFIDVGANLGYYTVLASKLVGPAGRVVAFEPHPYNFELLRQNLELNRVENAAVHQLALGDVAGSLKLRCSDWNFGDHQAYGSDDDRECVEVPVATLDAVLGAGGRCDVLKMDVQGFEPAVFRGMQALLRANAGIVVVSELWPLGMSRAGFACEEFLAGFTSMGLQPHVLTEAGEVVPIAVADLLKRPELGSNVPDDHRWMTVVFRRLDAPPRGSAASQANCVC
jgi:FkbM family methyltransferase